MKSKNNNIVETIINCLLNILIFIFLIILLISIYTGVQTKILGNDHNDFFGYSLFEVETGSMADTINPGDWIIVKLTQKVKINDIVTYKADGEYITHRIVETYKGTYITRGDANNANDEPVDQNQIVGKVIKVLANFGVVRKTLFNPSVLIALIITLFLFNYAIKKNKKEDTHKKVNKEEQNYLNTIAKKLYSLLDIIVEKIKSLIGNAKSFINKKKSKKVISSNNNTSKVEIKDVENKQAVYDMDKSVAEIKAAIAEHYKDSNNHEEDDHYKDEDELEKTSLFRVIPVDANEVGDKYKSAPTKAEVEEYYKDEDDLDKTSLYRIIPVDATEVNDTLLEIAKNEIKETGKKDKNNEKKVDVKPKPEEKEEAPEEESSNEINLDLLKNKKKKGKNIIDTAMIIKHDELDELIDILLDGNKVYANKTIIKDMFITSYIDAKYYNYYGNKNIEYTGKNLTLKIEEVIKNVAGELINTYHGKDSKYGDIVSKHADTVILVAYLEQANDSITDSKAKKEFYKKEIKKYSKDWDINKIDYVINEIIKIQKDSSDILEYFLKQLETSMFDLSFNKLTTKNNMYGLELKHNVAFSKVYSDYIIDKTYTEGIIAEDKISVLITLLLVQLTKDMTLSNFNRKYILYIPKSLYVKEQKLEKLLKMFDDKYAKDSIIILLTFEDLLSNKLIIENVRRMGYKFALVFDRETAIEKKDRGYMYIADYIFINKKAVNAVKLLPLIPEELLNKIVYEDIEGKVGDLGGSQS